jgi:aspartyl/asparaginyl-tRNA synthetase
MKAYPIQKQALPVEFLRDNAHLRARTDINAAMLRLRDSVLRTLHDYFEVPIDIPLSTTSLTLPNADARLSLRAHAHSDFKRLRRWG